MVRYTELLYDKSLKDVSFTHIGWDNTEYRCLTHSWSPDGKIDTLWLTIRENEKLKCINIINLFGCENDIWNQGKNTPVSQGEVAFEVQVDRAVKGVFFASPDRENCGSQRLDYKLKHTDRGITVQFSAPYVDCWSMVYILLEDDYVDISNINGKEN